MTAFTEFALEEAVIEYILFALATGQKKADVSIVGAYAAEALAQAIVRAVQTVKPAGGLPAITTI